MKYIFTVIMAGIMFFQVGMLAPGNAGAVSLWGDGSRSIFTDHKASQIGDILTILISESATTSTTKSSSNAKSGSQNLNAGTGIFGFLASATASGSDLAAMSTLFAVIEPVSPILTLVLFDFPE